MKIYNEERVLLSFFKGVVHCQILLTKIFTASVNTMAICTHTYQNMHIEANTEHNYLGDAQRHGAVQMMVSPLQTTRTILP